MLVMQVAINTQITLKIWRNNPFTKKPNNFLHLLYSKLSHSMLGVTIGSPLQENISRPFFMKAIKTSVHRQAYPNATFYLHGLLFII